MNNASSQTAYGLGRVWHSRGTASQPCGPTAQDTEAKSGHTGKHGLGDQKEDHCEPAQKEQSTGPPRRLAGVVTKEQIPSNSKNLETGRVTEEYSHSRFFYLLEDEGGVPAVGSVVNEPD